MKQAKTLLTAGFLSLACTLFSCVAPSRFNQTSAELEKRVESRPLVVGIEGLGGGYLVHNLTAEVAHDLELAQSASSGNYESHMNYIKETHKNHNPIYLVGFSSGANEVRRIAEDCEREGIPIDVLFLLDPTYLSRPFPGKIHKNVKKTVCFRSDDSALIFGGEVREENLENPEKTVFANKNIGGSHLELPTQEKVREIIESEIRGDLNERQNYAVASAE
jgi:hypothetical protein